MQELINFLSSFLGILTAFISKWLFNYYKNSKDRKKLLTLLKEELGRNSELLIGKGNLLQDAIWKMMINTGGFMLFNIDERAKISQIYTLVENHNYEAEKVRNISILSVGLRSQSMWKLHCHLSQRLIDNEKNIKKKIDQLLQENIW